MRCCTGMGRPHTLSPSFDYKYYLDSAAYDRGGNCHYSFILNFRSFQTARKEAISPRRAVIGFIRFRVIHLYMVRFQLLRSMIPKGSQYAAYERIIRANPAHFPAVHWYYHAKCYRMVARGIKR